MHLPLIGSSEDVIGAVGGILCFLQCAVLVASIFPTERALKKTFTKEGMRRQTPEDK